VKIKDKKDEAIYQCDTCSFILRQKKGDPPPPYCPNCKMQHLKGRMFPFKGEETMRPSPECEEGRREG